MCGWFWNMMDSVKGNDNKKGDGTDTSVTTSSQTMVGAPIKQPQPVGGAQEGHQPIPHPAEAYAASPQVYPQKSQAK